jgi:hypothetical protein
MGKIIYELVDFGYHWKSKDNDLTQIDVIFRNRRIIL